MERLVWAVSILWLSSDPIVAAAQCTDAACVRIDADRVLEETDSELLDLLFSSLTGTRADLSVADHRALSSARVSLDDLQRAMVARGIADGPQGVLSAEASLSELLRSIAAALGESDQTAAAAAADKLATQLETAAGALKLGVLLQVDGRPEAWSPTSFGALELISGLTARYNLAHGTAAHGVRTKAAKLGLAAPFEALELTFVALDAPVSTCGAAGSQLASAALRVRAHATLQGSPIALSASGVNEASFEGTALDLVISIGRMRGTLQAIDAIAPAVTLQVVPGGAALYAGTVSDAVLLDRSTPIDPDIGLEPSVIGELTVRVGATSYVTSVRLKSNAATSATTPSTLSSGGPFPQTLTLPSGATALANAVTQLVSSASVRLDAFDGGFTLASPTEAALEAAVASPVGPVLGVLAAGTTEFALELAGQAGSAPRLSVSTYPAPPSIACDDGNDCTAEDHCAGGACRGTPQVGAWCDDSLFCTQGEACDANGACSGGTPRNCDDGRDCTIDACDEVEHCVATNLPEGTICDDGRVCTDGDQCTTSGDCLGVPRVCSSQLTCATEACSEATGACEPDVQTGCLIDGACRVHGSLDPTSPCRYCDSAQSRTTWTSVPKFTLCDDEKTCMVGEMCDGAGECVGELLDCEDGDPCTVDTCEESDHGCVWIPALPGTACNDGEFCTVGETCSAEGQCTGEARSCADALSCTSDLCNELTDRCEHVSLLSCVIDRQCITDGQANPDDNCQLCDASVSTTAWSPRITLECLAMNPNRDPDEDGLPSVAECPLGLALCPDSDDDGQFDYLDPDDDEDQIGTRYEHAAGVVLDRDGDGRPDLRDPDDDSDGVLTRAEAPDVDGDGDPSDARDTDEDGIPDYLDQDDDGDGLRTVEELETAQRIGDDSDTDRLPDYRDTDSDGDGRPDGIEGDGDSDGNGIPDYLQPAPVSAGAAGSAAASGGSAAGSAGIGGAAAGAGGTSESDAGARDIDASDDHETSSNSATDPREATGKDSDGCSAVSLAATTRGASWWFALAIAALAIRKRRR